MKRKNDIFANTLIGALISCLLLIISILYCTEDSAAQWNPPDWGGVPDFPIIDPPEIDFPDIDFPGLHLDKRITTPRPLLFSLVSSFGLDTEITISNTSQDPLGTEPVGGTCTLYYYGRTHGNTPLPQPQTSNEIAPGEVLSFTLSAGNPAQGIDPISPIEGYMIADCTFPLARGKSVIRDSDNLKFAAAEEAEILSLPRNNAPQPLLFNSISSRDGLNTVLAILNTSADPFGSQGQAGSCTLHFYGTASGPEPVPAYITFGPIEPGQQLYFNLRFGGAGSNGIPGFNGYAIADCDFPMARGYAFGEDQDSNTFAFGENAEIISLPREIAPQPLLFSFATNRAGFDTEISISNTTLDPLGTLPQAGRCIINYHGRDLLEEVIEPQTTLPIPAGGQVNFTLSAGNPAQGIIPVLGFQGYITVDCEFPLARGLSLVSDLGMSRLTAAEKAERLELPRNNERNPLLLSYVSNQAGQDSGIVILNTSRDSLGTEEDSGTCTIHYYGQSAGGAEVPEPFTTASISPGEYAIFTLSTGGSLSEDGSHIPATPGFAGYIIVSCNFAHARGYGFTSDIGAVRHAHYVAAEVINPSDADGDHIPDYDDQCPNDNKKSEPGVCGCGVADNDSNDNGTIDCLEEDQQGNNPAEAEDNCPADPNKIDPGLCGCGVADTDSDLDGNPDCNDGCPTDPAKDAAGICGCNKVDIDADANGQIDCTENNDDNNGSNPDNSNPDGSNPDDSNPDSPDQTDNCPDDPNKTDPGVCGCGVSDIDANNNGAADCLDPTASSKPAKARITKKKKRWASKVTVELQKYPGKVSYKLFLKGKKRSGKRIKRKKIITEGNSAVFRLPPGRYKVFYRVEVAGVVSQVSQKAKFKIKPPWK